jgi:hypothetical protein
LPLGFHSKSYWLVKPPASRSTARGYQGASSSERSDSRIAAARAGRLCGVSFACTADAAEVAAEDATLPGAEPQPISRDERTTIGAQRMTNDPEV